MSKNENEARIYTGGRESARLFLRASSSHYTTIRMYGAVEKCGFVFVLAHSHVPTDENG